MSLSGLHFSHLLLRTQKEILNSNANNCFNYRAVIWGAAVNTVTMLRVAQPRKRRSIPSEQEDIFFKTSGPAVGPNHSHIQWVLSPEAQRPECIAEHSPPTSAKPDE